MIICYTVPEIWHVTDVIFIFYFGLFFALLPPNSPKNQNFKKLEKNPEISSFYTSMCTKNYGHMMCMVPEICCPTDGQMHGTDHLKIFTHRKISELFHISRNNSRNKFQLL